ncbi:MAG: purine-nucleoside phosphorylase [Chloroflexota bacterium]|nr:purine-nucleoside phosphorylase [Chloroflexota bacterium]
MSPTIRPTHQLFTLADFDEAADVIRQRISHRPRIGLVLGSGLGRLAERIAGANVLPYDAIPHFPRPSVEGHAGRLVAGRLGKHQVLTMEGRLHYYEGHSLQQVTFPIRVMQRLGIDMLIVTNAAGGLNPDFEPGDIMLITDQLNLAAMAGLSPLRGPDRPELGPRFPSMSEAYDLQLRRLTHRVASAQGLSLREGVYCMLAGPHFETPADLRFLRSIGVDAVGMSTVPEVLVARHGGMRVLGLSVISNVARPEAGSAGKEEGHAGVLAVADRASDHMCKLIEGLLTELRDLE